MNSFIASVLIISAIGAAAALLLSAASFLLPPKRRTAADSPQADQGASAEADAWQGSTGKVPADAPAEKPRASRGRPHGKSSAGKDSARNAAGKDTARNVTGKDTAKKKGPSKEKASAPSDKKPEKS